MLNVMNGTMSYHSHISNLNYEAHTRFVLTRDLRIKYGPRICAGDRCAPRGDFGSVVCKLFPAKF